MKRSRAPALPRAAGCPGEPPRADRCRARSVVRFGGVAARPRPSMHLAWGFFPASTGVVGRGSQHAPSSGQCLQLETVWGWPGLSDCTRALGCMPPDVQYTWWVLGSWPALCQGTCTSNLHSGTGSPALTETGTVHSLLAPRQWTLLSQPAPLLGPVDPVFPIVCLGLIKQCLARWVQRGEV